MGRLHLNTTTIIDKNYSSGSSFPTTGLLEALPFYRTDLHEMFHYDLTLGRWVGESFSEGFGDSGSHTDNQYFRRYNGMGTGPDRGVGFPNDMLIVSATCNWETPNTNTGSIEVISDNTVLFNIPTIGDGPSFIFPNVILPAGTILNFRRDGGTISNTQGTLILKTVL